MKKTTICLLKGLCLLYIGIYVISNEKIFSKNVIVLPELTNPDYIMVNHNQIIISEKALIYIYSLKDLKFINKFGKSGQGPREFQLYRNSLRGREKISVSVFDNRIWVGSLRKISNFTLNGHFIREMRITDPQAIALAPVGKNYLGVAMDREGFSKWFLSFNLYDSDGTKIKKICSHEKLFHTGSVNKRGMGLIFLDILTKGPEYSIAGDKIFISGSEGFSLDVYDQNGKWLKKISHPYIKHKIPGSDKTKILNAYRSSRSLERLWQEARKIIQVPDVYPEFRTFQISDQQIFIQTYKKNQEDTEFFVFDLDGNFLKKISLPLKYKNFVVQFPYSIKGEKIYQLVENLSQEIWELHITKIE